MLVSMRTSVPDQGTSLSRMLTILKSSMGNIITLNPFEVGDKEGLYIWSFGMSDPTMLRKTLLALEITSSSHQVATCWCRICIKTSVNVKDSVIYGCIHRHQQVW